MSGPNIAGMDLATTSGFCVISDEGVTTATFKANIKKNIWHDSKSLDAAREGEIVRKFEDFLRCWLLDNKIEAAAIESPLPSNTTRRKRVINTDTQWAGKAVQYEEVGGASMAAIFRMYALEGAAAAMCCRLNIPVQFIHQGTWRKVFLGTGKPKDSKKESKAMCEKLGIKINSADAAEAVGVAYAFEQIINPVGSRRANDLFNLK